MQINNIKQEDIPSKINKNLNIKESNFGLNIMENEVDSKYDNEFGQKEEDAFKDEIKSNIEENIIFKKNTNIIKIGEELNTSSDLNNNNFFLVKNNNANKEIKNTGNNLFKFKFVDILLV